MIINYFPKVLIIGETFHNKSGGGITLTNLFYEWPKNKLAVANDIVIESDIIICDNVYQLGYEEQNQTWTFLFSKSKRFSGVLSKPDILKQTPKEIINKRKKNITIIFRNIIKGLFNHLLSFTGLFNFFYKTTLSTKLLAWINDFKPDIIYFQINNYRNILLLNELYSRTKIPIAIHAMDDYISTINKPSLLYYYWKRKIDKEVKILINNSSLCMSISDSMSKEYFKRYGKTFHAFHNPVEIGKWEIHSKNDWNYNKPFRILYAGRYGFDNSISLHNLCLIVDKLNCNGLQIEFDLRFCTTSDAKLINKFKKYKHIHLESFIAHQQLPETLSNYDLLFLPLGFDSMSVRFTTLSMPTKVSEYMISGTPVLVCASPKTALYQYAIEAGWAYTVGSKEVDILENAIKKLYSDIDLRKYLGLRAKEIAKKNHDAKVVRTNFKELLSKAAYK